MSWIALGLTVGGVPALAASLYLAAMALLVRKQATPASPPPTVRFAVVVPAHDEELGISKTIESLWALDYPRELFDIVVVADNCRDRTAERAVAAGAQVLVRNQPGRRGKGYALAHAFDHCLARNLSDAIVVVDADTVASSNLLRAFAARLEAGAAAVQADYGVANPGCSWRTRLMTIALAAFHGVRSLARERLHLSCGLRGNGMGLSTAVLRAVPYRAFSIVEDLEYGLELGYAGYRVHYVAEARVLGEMVTTERASRSQRHRWERGRLAIARQHVPRLLRQARRQKDRVLVDLALDLIVPPVAQLAALNAIGGLACVLASQYENDLRLAASLWAGSAFGLLVYVARGWALSEVGLRGLVDLLGAPLYVLWKVTLWLRPRPHGEDEWIRTTREARL